MAAHEDVGRFGASNIPVAQDCVSANDQDATSATLPTTVGNGSSLQGISSSSLDGALTELLTTDSRRFGIPVIIRFAAAWAKECNTRHAEITLRLTQSDKRNTDLNEQVASYREQNAALRASMQASSKNQPLRVLALVGGPIVAGIGIDQIKSNQFGPGVALICIGLVMITLAIWAGRSGGTE